MLKSSMLALSALSLVAVPTASQAHHYDGYYNNGYREDDGYEQQEGYYPRGYEAQQQAYGYDNGYYSRGYRYRQHRCSGTTGLILGAGAGALLGRSLTRGSGYYHRNSGTTGAIVGAALGALVGRHVEKSTCG